MIAAAGGGIGMLLLPSGSDAPVASVEAAAEKTLDTVVEAALQPAEASDVAPSATETVAARTDPEAPVAPAANAVETVPVLAKPEAVTSATDPAGS